MNRIRIKFSGMGGQFDDENNFIIDILRQKYIVEISDSPDYLFFSVNSKDYLNYDCVRIFYTAENLVPDFNICDYAIGFHYLSLEDRYFRFPIYLVDGFRAYAGDDYANDLVRASRKHECVEKYMKEKNSFCAFVYSNAEAAPCRQKLFDRLSLYKPVDSGGRYLNNVGGPVNDKLQFQSKHKFVIAFENSSTPGYTTEKIVHAFSAGTIPIYWGDPKIAEVFNKDAFINCTDLSSKGEDEVIESIINRIIEIDNDDDLYRKMLETPAFRENYSIEMERQNLRSFLFHIFDQPIEQAYRRNRLYWGIRYERKQKIGNRFYWFCRKAIPIRDVIKNIKGR